MATIVKFCAASAFAAIWRQVLWYLTGIGRKKAWYDRPVGADIANGQHYRASGSPFGRTLASTWLFMLVWLANHMKWCGGVAQRESTSLTSKGSQVQSLSLPPFPSRDFCSRASVLALFCFPACVSLISLEKRLLGRVSHPVKKLIKLEKLLAILVFMGVPNLSRAPEENELIF